VGVEIFFALSGFVIVYTAQNATAGGFAKSRLLRLFPGALICATITLCTSILIGRGTFAGLIEPYLNSVFFWPYDPYIDGQYWTLGVEVTFYAVVFAILAFRAGARLEIAIATLGSTLAVFWILVRLNAPQSVAGLTDAMSFRHRMLFLQFGCDFALGAALFFASSRGLTLWRAVGVAVCYAGALCSFVTLRGVAPLPVIIWTTAIVGIALAPIVNRRATAALGSLVPAVGIAALATYPFYLLHEIVGTAVLRALVINGIERFSALFLMILIVGAASIIVTVYPERWLRRGMQKLLHWPSWLEHPREPQIERLSDGRKLGRT
jgi:peptidoglycan/LPS O-acetylase OafA/YrhL